MSMTEIALSVKLKNTTISSSVSSLKKRSLSAPKSTAHKRAYITTVSSQKKKKYHRTIWQQDESGKDWWVLGGYEDWHGIPREMIEAELQAPTEGMLVIAERRRSTIEVFDGPVHQLCKAKDKLHLSSDTQNYTFNCKIHGDYMKVVEVVPEFILRKRFSISYGEDEKERDKQLHEVKKILMRMSKEEQEEFLSRHSIS